MFIKQITIEGVEGDVEIRHTERGAVVIANEVEIEVDREDFLHQNRKADVYTVAYNAARVICGTLRNGEPNATNSMIHDILREIERVAG